MASGVTDKSVQARPSGTSPVELYSAPAGVNNVKLYNIWIKNTTGAAATYKLYYDVDGTTYDADSEIAGPVSVPADGAARVLLELAMDANGSFAVEQGTSQALNFTLTLVEFAL